MTETTNVDPSGFRFAVVGPGLRPDCYDLALQTLFVPKLSWTEPLPDMLLGGLVSGAWTGSVLLDPTGRLASYLDYKTGPDGIDVGICMTATEFRGRGLMSVLLSALVGDYPERDVSIGTCERNVAMRRVIEKSDFVPIGRMQDRVDGESSIYYRRRARGAVLAG